jgi:DNA polymerase-1
MNAQNLPKEAKKVFVPEDGWSFVQFDFSNLELRMLAIVSDDDVLKRTFKEGKNVHSENCKAMFQITEEDPLWSAARKACKTYIFGRNYGGGLRGIFERVAKAVPELNLTYRRFCDIDRAYRREHPAYTKWVSRVTERVKATRKLTSCFGRVRHFLGTPSEIVREGLNFPIQSPSADLMNLCLIKVYEYCKGKRDVKLIGTVHDSVLLEVKDNKVKDTVKDVKTILEAPVKIDGEEYVFPVDVEVGKSWGDLKEYKG